jgi:hypothetical protein
LVQDNVPPLLRDDFKRASKLLLSKAQRRQEPFWLDAESRTKGTAVRLDELAPQAMQKDLVFFLKTRLISFFVTIGVSRSPVSLPCLGSDARVAHFPGTLQHPSLGQVMLAIGGSDGSDTVLLKRLLSPSFSLRLNLETERGHTPLTW